MVHHRTANFVLAFWFRLISSSRSFDSNAVNSNFACVSPSYRMLHKYIIHTKQNGRTDMKFLTSDSCTSPGPSNFMPRSTADDDGGNENMSKSRRGVAASSVRVASK